MEVRRKRGRLQCEKESADTQECGSCQQNNMDLDVNMNENELCVEFHSKCGEQFGWMVRTQIHV